MIKATCIITSYKNKDEITRLTMGGYIDSSGKFMGYDGLTLQLSKVNGVYKYCIEFVYPDCTTCIDYRVKLSLLDKLRLLIQDLKSIPH